MTAMPIGQLRHGLSRLEPVSAPHVSATAVRIPVGSKALPRQFIIRSVFRAYGFLAAYRLKLLPIANCAATFATRTMNSPNSATFLHIVNRCLEWRPLIGVIAAQLMLIVLTAAIQMQLAASRKMSALRAARLINLIFRARIRSRRGLATSAYFTTLALCGAYDRVIREVPSPEPINGFAPNFAVGIAHMYCGDYAIALYFLERASASGDSNALRKLGCVHALMRDYSKAAACFEASAKSAPQSLMTHQNYAAGYDISSYMPSEWERRHAGELLIYDNLIQLGENCYHQGLYDDAFRCYQAALRHQGLLAQKWSLPDALVRRIAEKGRLDPRLPIRVLGYEWVTLIGHIGFIDCHLRMAKIGILPYANYVLLAPPKKVVNRAFLNLFASHVTIIEDLQLVNDLLPYQRLIGDQFIAVRSTGAIAEPWAHAAARAQVAWSNAELGPIVAVPADLRERCRARLQAAGINAEWFVALHVREGGYHGDGADTTRQHRSANVSDYLAAIEHVTSRGGTVIRLGDKSMTPLRGVAGVFDYAHSNIKSDEMDLFLCSDARFFIGTTSGLTSAVQALGTPMLLVNCMSNDCQFWHDKTIFLLKMIFDRRAHRYLSLRETYRQPLQARLIDSAVMARHGLEVQANRPEDIVEGVRYMLDSLEGGGGKPTAHAGLFERYRACLAENPYNFGAALPVPAFLAKFPELLADSN